VRVFSKFRDYYDSVQNTQYDEQGVVWVRNSFQASKDEVQKVLTLLRIEYEYRHTVFKPRDAIVLKNGYHVSRVREINHSCIACLICVAGKVYPMIEAQFRYYRGDEWNTFVKQYYDFDSFFTGHGIMGDDCRFYDKPTYPQWFFSINREVQTSKPWEMLNTPVFIIRPLVSDWRSKEYSIEGSPELKPLGFVKVLDPFTIWQEIDVFLNNQLVHELDPGNVPEKYRYIQYGFDPKWSFRTQPSS
jgi:hypothetical protein